MACWTRAWRPAGRGRTASRVASTALALAAIAGGSRLVSGAGGAALCGLLDMVPHFVRFPALPQGREAGDLGPLLAPKAAVSPATSDRSRYISEGFRPNFSHA